MTMRMSERERGGIMTRMRKKGRREEGRDNKTYLGYGIGSGYETCCCLGWTTTGGCSHSMGSGTGSGRGIGKIPFFGFKYRATIAAAARAFTYFFFLAETVEISMRRVEAISATTARVRAVLRLVMMMRL